MDCSVLFVFLCFMYNKSELWTVLFYLLFMVLGVTSQSCGPPDAIFPVGFCEEECIDGEVECASGNEECFIEGDVCCAAGSTAPEGC